jgi:hypothetical protein
VITPGFSVASGRSAQSRRSRDRSAARSATPRASVPWPADASSAVTARTSRAEATGSIRRLSLTARTSRAEAAAAR